MPPSTSRKPRASAAPTTTVAERGASSRALTVDRVVPSYVQVATQLRAQIVGGHLKPGERLPTEGDMAALFGVSRSTAREALRLLAAENLVETRRGVTGGSFIVHPDPKEFEITMTTSVDLLLGSEALTLDEVIEVWNSLETPAAGHAARRRTAAQARRLMDLSAPIPPRMPNAEIMVQTTAFHRELLAAAGNRFLQMLTAPLGHLAREEFMPTADLRKFLLHANDEHRKIAEAVAARNAKTAAALMQQHMEPRRAPRKDSRPL